MNQLSTEFAINSKFTPLTRQVFPCYFLLMEHRGRYIPNNLIKYRRMHGYRQEHVINFLGLKSTNRLSRWEKGVSMPNARNLFKLSILYHTLIDQLYSDHITDMKRIMSEKEELLASRHHTYIIQKK